MLVNAMLWYIHARTFTPSGAVRVQGPEGLLRLTSGRLCKSPGFGVLIACWRANC